MISATSYAAWKINEDIRKATPYTNTGISKEKVKQAIISSIEKEAQIKKGKVIEPKIDTSDWKTYMNEQYGFEVKYPRDWTVNFGQLRNIKDRSYTEIDDFALCSPSEKCEEFRKRSPTGHVSSLGVRVIVIDSSTNLDLEEIINKLFDGEGSIKLKEPVYMNDTPGIGITFSGPGPQENYNVFFRKNEVVYQIYADSYNDFFTGVINTFRINYVAR